VYELGWGTGTRRAEDVKEREAGGGVQTTMAGDPEGTRALWLSFHSVGVVGRS
jgi:hypothetical protein